jgi:hypothetical protein
MARCAASAPGTGCPACSSATARLPTRTAHAKIFAFTGLACAEPTATLYTFSKMRGAAHISVGRTSERLATIWSTRPST